MIQTVWIVNAVLQTAVLALVLWKRAWRQHPAFTFYIAYSCLQTPVLMWASLAGWPVYVRAAVIGRLIELPIMIAVLLEVSAAVFKPYSTLPKGALRWFMGSLGAVVAITLALAVLYPAATSNESLRIVLVVNRSAALVFCGAFGFIALFSSYFGIPWHYRTYGIGLGFLLFLLVDIVAASVAVMYPTMNEILLVVPMLAFTLAASTWLVYFAKPQTSRAAPTWEQLWQLREIVRSMRTGVVYAGRQFASRQN
ncbi:MAG: hypothetical protein ACE14M_05065 [Terriglobales bacterium]